MSIGKIFAFDYLLILNFRQNSSLKLGEKFNVRKYLEIIFMIENINAVLLAFYEFSQKKKSKSFKCVNAVAELQRVQADNKYLCNMKLKRNVR